MKIAVTYENGQVFQHFGHTKEFKVYTIEDGRIVSSEILSSGETGHEALAFLLRDSKIDALVCGGIGGGAVAALEEAGVALCAGASGDADEAVEAFLAGNLINSGVNCDHHEHEEEHSCGGDCGGCHGGCTPSIEGPNVGKTVRTHYRGTLNDGTVFDSSYDRGEPLEFTCGVGMMILGYDKAVASMKVGEKISIHLMPEEAYGELDPSAVFTIETSQMPGSENLEVGQRVYLTNMYGQQFPALVTAKEGNSITFDANHEMAGKELNFEIELVEVL